MMNEFRHFASPFGGTMGELMDATSSDLISKVFLEYKMFETWFHGRTVLIGDGKIVVVVVVVLRIEEWS